MLILITGGAASGKSAMAERYCDRLGGPLLYIATLIPRDRESWQRVERHRAQRAHLGFDTLECYGILSEQQHGAQYRTALLDCTGNLVANHMFECRIPREQLVQVILRGVLGLCERVEHLLVVHNDLSGDAEYYDGDVHAYLHVLGQVGVLLAQRADLVVEAVCGLPIAHKGKVSFL